MPTSTLVYGDLGEPLHLPGQDVHALGQAERRVGVAEAVGGPELAGRADAQPGLLQQGCDQVGMEAAGGFALVVGEYEIVERRRLADLTDTLQVLGDVGTAPETLRSARRRSGATNGNCRQDANGATRP